MSGGPLERQGAHCNVRRQGVSFVTLNDNMTSFLESCIEPRAGEVCDNASVISHGDVPVSQLILLASAASSVACVTVYRIQWCACSRQYTVAVSQRQWWDSATLWQLSQRQCWDSTTLWQLSQRQCWDSATLWQLSQRQCWDSATLWQTVLGQCNTVADSDSDGTVQHCGSCPRDSGGTVQHCGSCPRDSVGTVQHCGRQWWDSATLWQLSQRQWWDSATLWQLSQGQWWDSATLWQLSQGHYHGNWCTMACNAVASERCSFFAVLYFVQAPLPRPLVTTRRLPLGATPHPQPGATPHPQPSLDATSPLYQDNPLSPVLTREESPAGKCLVM